eukprot:scaffold5635_cov120-Isochrysis_galbana.AAC.4
MQRGHDLSRVVTEADHAQWVVGRAHAPEAAGRAEGVAPSVARDGTGIVRAVDGHLVHGGREGPLEGEHVVERPDRPGDVGTLYGETVEEQRADPDRQALKHAGDGAGDEGEELGDALERPQVGGAHQQHGREGAPRPDDCVRGEQPAQAD